MDSYYEVWIVGGHNHAYQITADIAKIAGVTTLISIYFFWIENHANDLAVAPTLPAHFVLRMVTELHAPLRAWRGSLSPRLSARKADFEGSAVDLGLGGVGLSFVGDGRGQDLVG